ncbi:unnamed protein product [Spirodela intermedia]|uniref:CRAL-TRIO domain-containing protein n=1 Tax=Spirodela intermedia TaxID=51605 RepID=A0A7I8IZR7_SPIIN|nr:unnamed protein product [Spirodela intermedia]CAA6663299.1 unnamed protein product [Spirodela intermedia]
MTFSGKDGLAATSGDVLEERGKTSSFGESQNQKRTNYFNTPLKTEKASSFSKRSFKSVKNAFKKTGRSSSLQATFADSRDPNYEHLVQNLCELLLSEGKIPEKYDDYHTLFRFLKARGYDLIKAKDMYLKMLMWREDCGVDVIGKDFKYEEYDEVKKCYPHGFHGVDKYGRPLYIERIGLVDLSALLKVTTIDRYLKYHISEQEKTLNLRYPSCSIATRRHIASTMTIVDVKGVTSPIVLIRHMIETLHQLFVVNAGSGFRVLWKVLNPFLDTRTFSKIQILGSQFKNKLLESVDRSNLPDFLGGDCTCAEHGGCLKEDIGPWNNLEVHHALKVRTMNRLSRKRWQGQNREGPHDDLTQKEPLAPQPNKAIRGQVDYDNMAQQISALEIELHEIEMILRSLLSRHGKLVDGINQLKGMTKSVSASGPSRHLYDC